MIKSVRLQNFFSFEDETIELHPEANVFVGINGSGKSNVLKAFKLLKEGMAGRLRQLILDQWGGLYAIECKGARNLHAIELTFEIGERNSTEIPVGYCRGLIYKIRIHSFSGSHNYSVAETLSSFIENGGEPQLVFEIAHGTGSINKYDPSTKTWTKTPLEGFDYQKLALPTVFWNIGVNEGILVNQHLLKIQIYEYFDTSQSSRIRRPTIATSEQELSSDGSNLPQILNTIKINDKESYRKILDYLGRVNENFTGIDFNFLGGNIELMLEEAKFGSAVHVTHISDGTLRFLCLMAIFFYSQPNGLVCIDEPESGLHPDMIKAIRDAISESYNRFGDDVITQYFITTHSDHLLDLFELANIRVVEKDDRNVSHVKTLSSEAFEGWYETFSPGHMWRLGDFGGNRY